MGHVDGLGDLTFVGPDRCTSGNCVEAARLPDGGVVLRSSTSRAADTVFHASAAEWCSFLDAVKAGRFDSV